MTESLPPDPLERLATLRRQFGEALPARIAALRARWEALCAAWDPTLPLGGVPGLLLYTDGVIEAPDDLSLVLLAFGGL